MLCVVILHRQFHLNIISTFATCDKKKWYNVKYNNKNVRKLLLPPNKYEIQNVEWTTNTQQKEKKLYIVYIQDRLILLCVDQPLSFLLFEK